MFWQQLVSCTVLRTSKNNFRNQNSCFLLKSHLVMVFRGINPHLSNAISQQPLSYWQKCYSLNLSETKTLGGCMPQKVLDRPNKKKVGSEKKWHNRVVTLRMTLKCIQRMKLQTCLIISEGRGEVVFEVREGSAATTGSQNEP